MKPGEDPLKPEPEHTGPIWKHPYFLYALLNLGLLLFLVFAAWLAWTQGWIPNRGIGGH